MNIPGSDVNKGEAKMEYIGSGPPKARDCIDMFPLPYKQSGHVDYADPVRNKTGTGNISSTCERHFVSSLVYVDESVYI